ncbi:MAG TPA: DUF1772 domain-containing protein [Gemmatimonadaceae bacterium]|nr:DUF1772 domain-containing protein [Gemmatimonadaceae bacterium]
MSFALIATICAGIFAGAALYITFVEHPARVSCGSALALREFAPSYRRATIMQAGLAIVGLFSALEAWSRTGAPELLVGGLALGLVVPFTLVVIAPTNRRLLAAELDPESAEAAQLLQRWGRLHAVRSVLSAVAFLILILYVMRARSSPVA